MTTHTTTRLSATYAGEGDDAALTSGSSSAVGDDALVCSWTRRFRDVGPVTLQLEGGPACARLYCDVIDGLAEGGGLAEAFLVEIFRCKLCQFTCGLKSAICSHLLMVHTSLEEAGIQRPPPTYTLELKHDDDDLLLYDMLHDIGPDAGLKVAHSCEVSSLFEDDESIFPVKTPSGSTDASSEETAQSAHLMTLGLCRITAPRPAAPLPEIPRPLVSRRARSTDQPSDPLTSEDAGKGAKKKNDACRLSKRHRAWRQANRRRQRRSAEQQAELKSCRRRTNVKKKKEEELGQKQPDSHDFGDADESRRVIERADRKKKKKKKVTTHLDRSAEGGNKFVCSLCHKKLSSKVTLQRHLGVHTGIKLFTCPTCPYTSRFKESLQQHVRTHTGEKPYRCALCPYASIDRSSLRRHSRTHSQEKPHKCLQCNYSSIQKKSLDLHARRHHTGETFPCQQCHYASADRQLLLRHMRRHHPPPPPAPPPQHALSPS